MSLVEFQRRSFEIAGANHHSAIVACTLSTRGYANEFADAREGAILHATFSGISVKTLNATGAGVAISRNFCVEEVKNLQGPVRPDYLIFLDDDMVFPMDTFSRIVDLATKNDADVLGMLATTRAPPFKVCAQTLSDEPFTAEDAMRLHEAGAVEEVCAVGMACTLIKVSLLDRMKAPYFSFYYNIRDAVDQLEELRAKGEEGEDIHPGDLEDVIRDIVEFQTSEDYGFCYKARKLGARIMCDFGIKTTHKGAELPGIGHVGTYAYSLKDAVSYGKNHPAPVA